MSRTIPALLAAATTLLLTTTTPSSARAQGLQLDASIFDGAGVTAGVWLEGGVALMAGIRGFHGEMQQTGYDDSRVHTWEIPVEAKIYLDEVEAESAVPTLLVGTSYGLLAWGDDPPIHSVAARALLGVDYWATAQVAIHAGAGLMARHGWGEGHRDTVYAAVARAGFTLRP